MDKADAEKLKHNAQKILNEAKNKNHQGLRQTKHGMDQEIKDLNKGIKDGHSAAITSLVTGGVSAMVGMASLFNQHANTN